MIAMALAIAALFVGLVPVSSTEVSTSSSRRQPALDVCPAVPSAIGARTERDGPSLGEGPFPIFELGVWSQLAWRTESARLGDTWNRDPVRYARAPTALRVAPKTSPPRQRS